MFRQGLEFHILMWLEKFEEVAGNREITYKLWVPTFHSKQNKSPAFNPNKYRSSHHSDALESVLPICCFHLRRSLKFKASNWLFLLWVSFITDFFLNFHSVANFVSFFNWSIIALHCNSFCVQGSEPAICIHISPPFWTSFPPHPPSHHLGHHRAPSWAPCAMH